MNKIKFVFVLLVSLGLVTSAFAWAEPGQDPPGGDADPPINVSSDSQTKNGPLTANGLLRSIGKLFVGDGAMDPTFPPLNPDGSTNQNHNPNFIAQFNGIVKACDTSGANCQELGAGSGTSFWADRGSNNISNTNTGNVGIGTGTAAPGAKLEARGTAYGEMLRAGATGASGYHSGGVGIDSQSTYWGTSFFVDGAKKMVLDSNGALLIGPNYINSVGPDGGLAVEGQIRIGGGSPLAGKVLTATNSTGIATWEDPSGGLGGGDITKVIANGGLAGGGDSGDVTISVAADGITSDKIAPLNVVNSDIANGVVDSAKITDGTIAAVDIATDAITASKIAAGSVYTGEIADGTITTDDIAANTIAAVDIQADAVGTSEIAAGAVTTDEIAMYAVTNSKLNLTMGATGDITEDTTTGFNALMCFLIKVDGGGSCNITGTSGGPWTLHVDGGNTCRMGCISN